MPDADPSTAVSLTLEPSVACELTDRELAILRATRNNSLSTVAIAEHIGLGLDPTLVTPLLDRLERLDLLDGFYAAGRVLANSAEIHRRYYRSTPLGRQVV